MATTSASATAVLTGAFLSGAMMSLSLMTVPVLLDTTTQAPQLFHQWGRMYHYGHQVLPTMAVGTFILYGYTAFKQRRAAKSWIVFALAGLVTVSMLPYTWIVMVPTNNELFRLERETQEGILTSAIEDAQTLVIKWTWMHLTRSLMPLIGAVLGTIGTRRT